MFRPPFSKKPKPLPVKSKGQADPSVFLKKDQSNQKDALGFLQDTDHKNLSSTAKLLHEEGFKAAREQTDIDPTFYKLSIPSLLATVTAAVYSYFQGDEKDKLPHVEDISFTTLDDLKNEILEGMENTSKKDVARMKSILDCIHANDLTLLTKLFNEIKSEKNTLAPDLVQRIVRFAAFQGKVGVLDLMSKHEYFGAGIIDADPLARKLTSHPNRNDIEKISGEFVAGLGNIKSSGERSYLSFMQENIAANEISNGLPEVYGLDSIEDISVMYAFVKERFQSQHYRSEKISDITVIKEDPDRLKEYLEAVKDRAKLLDQPLHCRFILAGGHFTFGDIIVKKQDGNFKAEIFHFDSLGATADVNPFDPYVAATLEVFPDVQFYSSEQKLQNSMKGCSIFTLLHTQLASDLDELLPRYEHFDSQSESPYLDYCKQNVTETVQSICYDDDSRPIEYRYQLFVPPPNFSKQSFKSTGEVDEFILNEKKDDRIQRKVTRVGHMGLDVEKQISEKRKKEFEQHTLLTGETPDQLIRKHTEYVGQNKPINKAVEHLTKQAGPQLVLWMVNKSPTEIEELKKAHALEAYQAKTNELTSEKNRHHHLRSS